MICIYIRNFQPYPLNFADEQAGERCHRRSKFGRTHLSRKTSAEDNIIDMMRLSLVWSDPKLSDLEIRTERKRKAYDDTDFSEKMAYYYLDSAEQYSAHADSDVDKSECGTTDSETDNGSD